MKGHWVSDKEHEEDIKLHNENYEEWHKKHNTPNSESRQFLEHIFPGLRKVEIIEKSKPWWKFW